MAQIYKNKETGKRYIGVEVEQHHGNVVANSTMVDMGTGKIVSFYTNWFEYVGEIIDGRFTSLEEMRKAIE